MGAHTGAFDITGLLGRFRPGPRSKEPLQGEGEGEGERERGRQSAVQFFLAFLAFSQSFFVLFVQQDTLPGVEVVHKHQL